jgi:hypothetical protein
MGYLRLPKNVTGAELVTDGMAANPAPLNVMSSISPSGQARGPRHVLELQGVCPFRWYNARTAPTGL